MLVGELFEMLNVSKNAQNQIHNTLLAMNNIKIALNNAIKPLVFVLPDMVKTFSQIQEQMIQIQSINEKMRTEGFDGALRVFSFGDVIDLKDTNDFDATMYQKTIDENFISLILETVKDSEIHSHRYHIIEEAVKLHKSEMFHGSITLSLSQIEGIINDFLIHHKIASYDVDQNVIIDEKKITGIKKKLESILKRDFSDTSLMNELSNSAYIGGDNKRVGINDVRNGILHGSNICYGSQKMSTQTILWLYAIVIEAEFIRKATAN